MIFINQLCWSMVYYFDSSINNVAVQLQNFNIIDPFCLYLINITRTFLCSLSYKREAMNERERDCEN